MKKTLILIHLICAAAIGSNIRAQEATPPGAGDKDLRDTNVKIRSVELERVGRDARQTDKSATVNPAAKTEDDLAAKYDRIKLDYEQIQLSQDAVINAYKSGVKIDYAQIAKSALEIKTSASWLNSNLFPAPPPVENTGAKTAEKKEGKIEKEKKPAKSVRDLIVELDGTIGSFVTSSMFQNLRTADADVSAKAESDLEKIIELSALLSAEAEKMSKKNW